MGLDQLLKKCNHHRGECNWVIVVMTGWMGFFGYGDDGRLFKACGDDGLCQGQVEYSREHWCQLVGADLENSSSYLVWSRSLPGVHLLKCPPDIVFRENEWSSVPSYSATLLTCCVQKKC